MSDESVNNLSDLLRSYLGTNKEIKNVEINRLTLPGENFGSVMLKVDITTVRNDDNTEEKLYAVAKKIPASEMFREVFNIQVTFKNEMAFYTSVVPTLQNFQRECGVEDVLDCFADLYGGRISLDETRGVVDDDAVLMLENLSSSGYVNIDRTKQFDLDEAKVVIKDLATFHGVGIALKMKKPEVFENNVKKFCRDFEPTGSFSQEGLAAIKLLLNEKEDLVHIIPKLTMWGEVPLGPRREPFATVTHNDLWLNNTMQKFENGKIVKNKFIDFQVYNYRSPATDLFFFMWTSIRTSTLQKHLDEILQYYHENLIDTQQRHFCDTKDFGYDKFLEEIKLEAAVDFTHALQFALFVVHGVKGKEFTAPPTAEYFYQNTTDVAKEKLYFMVEECYRRGWI